MHAVPSGARGDGSESGAAPSACVLIVDDDPASREVLRGYLDPTWRVLEASSGLEALEILAGSQCDLVLLDVMMPGIDGYDTCRLVKARHTDGFLPVLMLTALGDRDHCKRGLEAGADDYLVKPVDRQELWLRVRSFLTIRRQEQLIRRQLEEQRRWQAFKEDLLALLVHDVRTPLLTVVCHLQLMQRQLAAGDSSNLQQHLEPSVRSARRLRAMLDDFLDIRRLEDDELPVRREETAIATLLGGVVESVGAIARQRDVRIELLTAADLRAEVDPGLVWRAVENITVNAIRHSPRGGTVTIAGTATLAGVQIEVRDQGPGVPPQQRDVIFARFETQDAAPTSPNRQRGFGLGLYLVRLVVAAHAGTVSVHDNPGGGAAFRVQLPLRTPRRT